MDDQNEERKEGGIKPDEVQDITFKYLKSNFYRVIHANGAFGGVTGRGEIHIGFYSERLEFPDKSTITISPTGEVLPETFDGGGQPIREIEADLVISLFNSQTIASVARQ